MQVAPAQLAERAFSCGNTFSLIIRGLDKDEKGMKMRKKNPFRVSFLCVAVICCVALSIVFFYIN